MARLHFTDEAEMYAYKAWQTLKLEPPADLQKVAQRLGIEVCEREFSGEVDGLYLRLPDVPPIIAINNSYIKPQVRRRFTLAHEIGHHLLSRRIQPGSRMFFFDTSSKKISIMERACDRFAALLLMPEDWVRRYFEELSFNPRLRVQIMASRFDVSMPAMRRRLRELGLQENRFNR
ncbi:MAG: ImmA/IrrE family metallo-endopeptidase [Armatimonadetes bacterium]|jgi:Zn-dependent peptidase ImmA (M78 family)|nr:ImmA/IrrE family metallo-endopeptidase [Armatimonadota bacterium]